jgi:hypothetical protein
MEEVYATTEIGVNQSIATRRNEICLEIIVELVVNVKHPLVENLDGLVGCKIKDELTCQQHVRSELVIMARQQDARFYSLIETDFFVVLQVPCDQAVQLAFAPDKEDHLVLDQSFLHSDYLVSFL